jgi:hypothetical protein
VSPKPATKPKETKETEYTTAHYVANARDLKKYIDSKKNTNTVIKTQPVVTRFQTWLGRQHEGRKMEKIPHVTLDVLLGTYLMTTKKDNGEKFEPDTLTSHHRAIARHLDECDYGIDIGREIALTRPRTSLKGRRTSYVRRDNSEYTARMPY